MNETEILFNGYYLRLCRRDRWEFAERTNSRGAVIVIAVTNQDEVLFVEQYRAAIQAKTIELPAGLIGDEANQKHETAQTAAQRELLEETGYNAERIDYLMTGPSSAGMSNEMLTFVRAHGLTRVNNGGGDHTENITVHEVPRRDVATWLQSKLQQGYSLDPKLFVGLYFLEQSDNWKSLSQLENSQSPSPTSEK